MEWAYEYTGVDPSDSLDVVSQKLASSTLLDDPVFHHAKAILLPIHRYITCDSGDPLHSTSPQTPFQSLLLFILQRLGELKYRRHNDACYARISGGSEKEPSYAYERVCSIREFILREARKDTEPEQWKHLTNPRDNLDVLARHLAEADHAEFKTLTFDDRFISFRNGTYSVADNVFWPHDLFDEWSDFAEEVQNDRRTQGWPKDYTLVPPHPTLCSIAYVDRQFRLLDDTNKQVIETVRSLLTRMGIKSETHGWLFALFGRLLFPINHRDKWSVMPFFKTSEAADNTAVSTIKSIYEVLIGPENVAQVASGANVQHSLETLMHARVCAVLLRDLLPLEQGDWQSVLCGEYVCINPSARGRTSFSHQWTSHLFAAGPCIGYKNDAGTVDRRVVMFDVSDASVDDFRSLGIILNDNIDIWVQTIVDAYLLATHEHSSHDIWTPGVLPSIMHDARDALKELITPLVSCAKSSLFSMDTQLFMPLADFKDIYYDFRRRRGLPPQRWIREHWQATFNDLGLTIERSQREYRGVRSTADWLVGLDATVNSHGQSLIVTRDMVKQLEVDESRIDGELKHIREKISVAQKLCEVEEEVNRLKTLRTDLRQQYETMLD